MVLYIFWFLHQTTTWHVIAYLMYCCISFDSYIKSQRNSSLVLPDFVVYLLIPTSNHNISITPTIWVSVVYLLIPTSNHNSSQSHLRYGRLYIFWFLHQITTLRTYRIIFYGCISFDSYIKSQPRPRDRCSSSVVYLLIPTSNHNSSIICKPLHCVVYLLIPTSNHNLNVQDILKPLVVYLLIPTSNHNSLFVFMIIHIVVYLLIPTSNHNLSWKLLLTSWVVYLLIPTSNHNLQNITYWFTTYINHFF